MLISVKLFPVDMRTRGLPRERKRKASWMLTHHHDAVNGGDDKKTININLVNALKVA